MYIFGKNIYTYRCFHDKLPQMPIISSKQNLKKDVAILPYLSNISQSFQKLLYSKNQVVGRRSDIFYKTSLAAIYPENTNNILDVSTPINYLCHWIQELQVKTNQ